MDSYLHGPGGAHLLLLSCCYLHAACCADDRVSRKTVTPALLAAKQLLWSTHPHVMCASYLSMLQILDEQIVAFNHNMAIIRAYHVSWWDRISVRGECMVL